MINFIVLLVPRIVMFAVVMVPALINFAVTGELDWKMKLG